MNFVNVTKTLQQLKFQNDGLLQSGFVDPTALIDFVQLSSHQFKMLIVRDIANFIATDHTIECFQAPVVFTEVVDQYWLDFQRPTIKYFEAQLKRLANDKVIRATSDGIRKKSRGRKRVVEVRKLYSVYLKCNRIFCQFHIQLITELLTAYKLDAIGSIDRICRLLRIGNSSGSCKDIKGLAVCSQLIYVIHRSLLYLGNLSRYRTLLATKYVSPGSLSRQDKKKYDKCLECLNLAILLLPSQGDPYNYIGLTEELRQDNLNIVYNFARSTMTRIHSPNGFMNLILHLSSEILISTISKAILEPQKCQFTINSKLVSCNNYFIAIFGFYFLPKKWNNFQEMTFNDASLNAIENNYRKSIATLDIHRPPHLKVLWQQAIILISGYTILSNPKFNHEWIDRSENLLNLYLQFVFLFIDEILTICTSGYSINIELLPLVRLFLCWANQGGVPLHYLMRNSSTFDNLVHVCEVASLLVDKNELCISKPQRQYYFHEDVDLKEFVPIGCRFKDFNDSWILDKSQDSYKALIGELPDEASNRDVKSDEDALRIKAISFMVDQLLKSRNKLEVCS
ncbi:BA75_04856T0 [Komagataella pastoris]|uniref:BA75_04856T0 n=1 Tax=Komagataella pastoris TaxID=4922 RepID=A0A1B2JI44_PICPA|nr:BA75_04856T0 [Komagataella pastoris]